MPIDPRSAEASPSGRQICNLTALSCIDPVSARFRVDTPPASMGRGPQKEMMMNTLWLAGLMLGSMAASDGALEHRVQMDHHSGPVAVRYSADVGVTHKQIGAVTTGGRPSTLRCQWSANVTVHREARADSGVALVRSASRDGVIEGSRPGWCSANRNAIAQEVARRHDAVRDHLQAVAQEDHGLLRAEMDRLHTETRAG